MRARDLGIRIGLMEPGAHNAITDVAGVRVGHTTLIEGAAGELVRGTGPVRTGVTVVVPSGGDSFAEACYAGAHRLNGNGELTGLEWIREAGLLAGPIAITNTHSVGVVRDAIVAAAAASSASAEAAWSLPVVGETWDGWLNDIDGQHVRSEHLIAALDGAAGGAVAEGSVGGGTGMICHRFKGGIGTSSRVLPAAEGGFTVAALVQANYGRRERLAIDGVPVGREIGFDEVPSDREAQAATAADADAGSIIVVLATDAPLLPHQCERLAQRAGLGVARSGGAGEHSSGDLFIAFATGNRGLSPEDHAAGRPFTRDVQVLDDAWISPLFWAAIESSEEAIVNALVAAETMSGQGGHVAYALPHDRLAEVWRRYRG
jgi:D-aminopeptidase